MSLVGMILEGVTAAHITGLKNGLGELINQMYCGREILLNAFREGCELL